MIQPLRFFRCLWHIWRDCDEHEWLACPECKWRLIWWSDDDGSPVDCPSCGAVLHVQLPRKLSLELALYDLRTAYFPQRLYTWSKGEYTTMRWNWRGHDLFAREVPNFRRRRDG